MTDDALLDKDRTPDAFEAPKIRRLNRLPLLIAFLVAMILVGALIFAASQRGNITTQRQNDKAEKSTISPSVHPAAVEALVKAANRVKEPEPEPIITTEAPDKPDVFKLPELKAPSPEAIARQQMQLKIAQMKAEAMLQAVIGGTSVKTDGIGGITAMTASHKASNITVAETDDYADNLRKLEEERQNSLKATIRQAEENRAKQEADHKALWDEALTQLGSLKTHASTAQPSNLLASIAGNVQQAVESVPVTQHASTKVSDNQKKTPTDLAGLIKQLENPSRFSTKEANKPPATVSPTVDNPKERAIDFNVARLSDSPEGQLLQQLHDKNKGEFLGFKRVYGYHPEHRKQPLNATLLRVGTIIPAVLITGINSDLSGEVLAQVSYDVRDTATGNSVLIPKGAKLVGQYDDKIKNAQNRIGVNWHRLQFPDGSSLEMGSMAALDQSGFTGMVDRVNNHYVKKYGTAALLSLMSAGSLLSQGTDDNANSVSGQFKADLGRSWAQLGQSIIEKNLDISPTIIIRPGYAFNVMVNRDLVLNPY